MAKTTLKGEPVTTQGEIPKVGDNLKDFTLVNEKLIRVHLSDFIGSKLVLNIFPSLDTPVCASSVRHFNEEAGNMDNTKILCISRDLPFAMSRFCTTEGLEDVVTLSDFANRDFGKNYGTLISDGPLQGLHARCVIAADETGKILHVELVSDIANEPDYEAVLKMLK